MYATFEAKNVLFSLFFRVFLAISKNSLLGILLLFMQLVLDASFISVGNSTVILKRRLRTEMGLR